MIISPHNHPDSPLTGSTLANMIARSKELKRTHFAHSDHGHLSSSLKAYNLCKKAGLKFIPGIEIYFRDSQCQILSGTEADRCRYFTLSVYAKDQTAFQEISKIVSREDLPTIEINEEKQYLWGWAELREISKFNVEVVLGGPHCMVGKVMLAGRADLSQKILEQLNYVFLGRISLALVCEPWTKKYSQVVEIDYDDGSKDSLLASDSVSTDRARRIKAIDLTTRSGHSLIKSKVSGGMGYEVNKTIKKIKLHKGFLPLPGGDAMLKINRFFMAMGRRHAIPVLVSDYAYYAHKEDKIVQTMRLEGKNKLQQNLHMKNEAEISNYLTSNFQLSADVSKSVIDNNSKWAAKFDSFEFKFEWRLAEVEGSAIQRIMAIVKENGRMKWDNPVYVARLNEEINVIHKNGIFDLSPYFLPIRDVLNAYLEAGFLTGPGRGSAGGSLLCYLMGITQLDPIVWNLPFQRFFSMARIKGRKLPDIDVDLEDRTFLVGEDGKSGYLYGKYGDRAAQISTRTTIRLKSAILDTNRYFKGKVEDSIATFSKGLPAPPQGVSDLNFVFGFEDDEGTHHDGLMELSEDLQKYAKERPEEWSIVSKAMGLTRAYSKHASAFVIANVPIKDVIPTKDGNITQYEAKEVEAAGLIKYDFLVVKQLKDIRVAMDLIKKKHGRKDLKVTHFPHEGKDTFIWDLPQVPEVFKSTWDGSTETMFQINTASMRPHLMNMKPASSMDVATLLALVRPGPLDFIDESTGRNMVEEYMLRRKGEAKFDIPEMAELLPETYAILAYQEQLGTIARNLAGMSSEDAELLRENMAKKKMEELLKMKPVFMEGAIKNVSKEVAESIWDRMVTFGRYGFSVIHAVEYAMITYACMFLKYYYPLEWWASVLTNATEQEISGKFWPYVRDLVAAPDINLSSDEMVIDYKNHKIRAKFGVIRGLGEASIEPIVAGRPYANIEDYVDKGVAGTALTNKLIHVGVLDSLFPPKSTLEEKFLKYAQAVENKKYAEKVARAEEKGKKVRDLQPKTAQLPDGYSNLHPIVDAAMKKSVLPSMPLSTTYLGANFSKVLIPYTVYPQVKNMRKQATKLINGDQLQRLDEIPGESVKNDIYVASTAYIVKAEEFAYSNNTKRALKLIIDVDGYVSEKVLWPDYELEKLIYPENLKKGSIATLFFRKRINKKDLIIQQIELES